MGKKVYIDGKFVEAEDAKISVFDHGLLYGDGVFEGLRSYSGKVFRLAQHIDRLWESASAIKLTIPYTKDQIAAAVNEALFDAEEMLARGENGRRAHLDRFHWGVEEERFLAAIEKIRAR